MSNVLARAAVALALGLLVVGCGHAQAPAAGADLEASLLAQMRQAIGDAPCSSDAQCRTVAVGAKACGGPAAWWAWSEAHGDAAQLQAWSTQLDRVQRRRLEVTGQQSDCRVVPDPGAACVARRCVLRARAGAAAI